jgi:hypothetical protein|tara:strand:- start:97 stop:492 length:396 start_codon:yes stop_codon:yes gene_type:complete
MDYNADFRYDLKVGQDGEKLLAEMLGGTKGDTIEVKSEIDRWVETGNHFVETWSRGKRSGLSTTQAKYWAVNFYKDDEFQHNIILPVDKLKKIIKLYRDTDTIRKKQGGDNNTSEGWLVPINLLIQARNEI